MFGLEIIRFGVAVIFDLFWFDLIWFDLTDASAINKAYNKTQKKAGWRVKKAKTALSSSTGLPVSSSERKQRDMRYTIV